MTDNKDKKVLNVPALRFPEFSGEWKEQVLSDFVERVTRKNKSNQCKMPLTISAQYGLVDQISFFNKVIASNDMSSYYLLYKGDFAYNKSYMGRRTKRFFNGDGQNSECCLFIGSYGRMSERGK